MARKEVRVFLDSNVILSGLISEKGPPRIILDILSLDLPFITGVTGRYNIIEIERNLTRKAPQALPVYKRYFSVLHLKIIPTPTAKDIKQYSGHIADKDAPVLVSAIKGKADFLVTGDKKDFDKLKAKGVYPFKIVTPTEFVDVALSAILKDREK
jgi:putative PIN family toxin of toxin-antitoxin system